MKIKITAVILILTIFNGYSQTTDAGSSATLDMELSAVDATMTRIHLLYKMPGWNTYRLQTTLQAEPLKLKPQTYAVIETDTEEIGLFKNAAANNLPVKLSFEKGKNYFFRIYRPTEVFGQVQIDELTERAFKMELFANDISPKPEVWSFLVEKDIN